MLAVGQIYESKLLKKEIISVSPRVDSVHGGFAYMVEVTNMETGLRTYEVASQEHFGNDGNFRFVGQNPDTYQLYVTFQIGDIADRFPEGTSPEELWEKLQEIDGDLEDHMTRAGWDAINANYPMKERCNECVGTGLVTDQADPEHGLISCEECEGTGMVAIEG